MTPYRRLDCTVVEVDEATFKVKIRNGGYYRFKVSPDIKVNDVGKVNFYKAGFDSRKTFTKLEV